VVFFEIKFGHCVVTGSGAHQPMNIRISLKTDRAGFATIAGYQTVNDDV
jgi:hypothetical protein